MCEKEKEAVNERREAREELDRKALCTANNELSTRTTEAVPYIPLVRMSGWYWRIIWRWSREFGLRGADVQTVTFFFFSLCEACEAAQS